MGSHQQRERNINQLQPGTIQANPGINVERAAALPGLRPDPPVRERRQVLVQRAAGRAEPPLHQRARLRGRLHVLEADQQRRRQAQPAVQRLRRQRLPGDLRQQPHARARRQLPLRAAVLARAGHHRQEDPRRLADLRRHLPLVRELDVRLERRRRGRRRRHHATSPGTSSATSPRPADPGFSQGVGQGPELLVQPRRPSPSRRRAPSATRAATSSRGRTR